jgi:hypothetical protein
MKYKILIILKMKSYNLLMDEKFTVFNQIEFSSVLYKMENSKTNFHIFY